VSSWSGYTGWTLRELIYSLLSRCAYENDRNTRILVATCFGEIGAIAAYRFEDATMHCTNPNAGRRGAPWQCTPHQYQFSVLTDYLVPALLAAAPKVWDQNKIAFAIQQVLVLLNEAAKEGALDDYEDSTRTKKSSRRQKSAPTEDATLNNGMERILADKLERAHVFATVEPYWSSKFKEVRSPLDPGLVES
jgi:hypothetical protein